MDCLKVFLLEAWPVVKSRTQIYVQGRKITISPDLFQPHGKREINDETTQWSYQISHVLFHLCVLFIWKMLTNSIFHQKKIGPWFLLRNQRLLSIYLYMT